jgi:hypothetical protein
LTEHRGHAYSLGMAKQSDTGGYPYSSLPHAIKVGAAVKDHGGRNVPRSLVAEALSMDHSASGFWSIVASARVYGIVEGSKELSLTETGREYFYANSEASQRLAMLTFLASPVKFRTLLDAYDGSGLPSMSMLTSALKKAGMGEAWAGRAASFFANAVREAGAVDENGFLRFSAAKAKAQKGVVNATLNPKRPANDDENGDNDHQLEPEQVQPQAMPRSESDSQHNRVAHQPGKTVWQYGGMCRIETPDPLSRGMWEKLKLYIDLLEPSDENH